MKTKHKRQRVFTSNGSAKRSMKSAQRMIWKDTNGFSYYQTKQSGNAKTEIIWQPVRHVTGDIWILDHTK